MRILSRQLSDSRVLSVLVELEFVSSKVLAIFLDDISDVDAATNPRIMVSPLGGYGSVTRFSLAKQNRIAAALRLPDEGQKSLGGCSSLGRHFRAKGAFVYELAAGYDMDLGLRALLMASTK